MSTRANTIAVGPARTRDERYYRYSRILSNIVLYGLVLASLTILLLPIAWMLSTSFKPLSDVFQYPPRWIPETPTLDGYRAQFNTVLGTYFFNSVVIGACSAALSTLAGALAAYGIARFRFRGNSAILMFFMASLAFPIPLLMISMYLLFVQLHMLNTYASLIIGHTVITMPVAVWLLKNFFDQLPVEVEEAAYVDGASPLYTLFRIVLPMARPALGASAIFVFVTSWNELLFGLTFTSSTDMRPLPAGISMSFLTEFEGAWSEMMALSVMVSLPVFLLFIFFQRTFMSGVTAGAVKG
ncbi:MAG: carbohydrate ABC transporter permease [Pseudomonadota bacterium]